MIQQDRLSEHLTRTRLKLELTRSVRPLIVLAIGVVAAGYCGQYILSHIRGGVGSTHQMRFEVADATGVVPGRAEVRFKGIEAGVVDSVNLVGGQAVITADVANKFGTIYRNATAQVRPNTALQDMYLDITSRGTPSVGKVSSGYIIPEDQTQSPVNAADILDTFTPGVRAHLDDILDQLGNGLADRGTMLRQAFIQLAPFLKITGQVAEQFAARAQLTKTLVHNAAILSQVLAGRNSQLRSLVANGASTLRALSTQNSIPLRQTLQQLPPTLTALDSAFTDLNGVLPDVNDAVTSLYPVAGNLPSSLSALRSLAASADPAVVKLTVPVQQLVPLASSLRPLSAGLASSLQRISPQTADVNHITTALTGCGLQINEFFEWTADVFKFGDAQGQFPRGDFDFNLSSVPTFADPNTVAAADCAGGSTLKDQPTN
jgi:virulence factor Mce-like protein